MPKTEDTGRKRKRRRDLQAAVLTAVGAAGVLSVAMLAPNLVRMMPNMGADRYAKYRSENALGLLIKKGLVHVNAVNGVRTLSLTEKGRTRMAFEIERMKITNKKRPRWDEQWRMVMFDIPERRRAARTRLRQTMRRIGFYRIQDSVWVYPYDCEEFVALLKRELKSHRDVVYAVISSIENDSAIRTHFKFPPA